MIYKYDTCHPGLAEIPVPDVSQEVVFHTHECSVMIGQYNLKHRLYGEQVLDMGDPGTNQVQEFLLTQGDVWYIDVKLQHVWVIICLQKRSI